MQFFIINYISKVLEILSNTKNVLCNLCLFGVFSKCSLTGFFKETVKYLSSFCPFEEKTKCIYCKS